MPKILNFALCDNVLLGYDKSVSLIQVTNQFLLSGVFPDPIPADAAIQIRWYIFAQWEILEGEFGRSFEQRVRLVNGANEFFETEADFTAEAGKNIHRMIASLTFFPLVPAGHYRMLLEIRETGEGNEWQQAADYPLDIVYRHIAAPAQGELIARP